MSTELDGDALQARIASLASPGPQWGLETMHHGTDFPEDLGPEEIASMGVAKAQGYMMRNDMGVPKDPPKVMSKAQLEEQKMNEAVGYPSNLDEANKVKQLEGDVIQIKDMMSQMMGLLQGKATTTPTPALPREQQCRGSENESKAVKFPVLGQSQGITVEEVDETSVEEDILELQVAEDPTMAAEEKRATKTAQMVAEVVQLLQQKDPLKFWQTALKRSISSRFLAFDGWHPEVREGFIREFKNLLGDSEYLSRQVRKILSFEQGHGVSAQRMAELIILATGGTAFVMSDV